MPSSANFRGIGIPITWGGGTVFAVLLLGMSWKAALMLGAILIVSGPTVVTPILRAAKPGKNVTAILTFEGATLDPIGALIAVGVFQALKANHANGLFGDLLGFVGRIGLGVIGGAVGILVLWFLLKKLKLKDAPLAIEAIFATVITVAAVCDAIESDTGLVAAIVMGAVLANFRVLEPAKKRPWLLQNTIKFLRGTELPEQHPMLKAIVSS